MALSMKAINVDISVVIPVRNEAENILPLARELESVMDKEFAQWECIWVDDGSNDGTLDLLRELERANQRHRFISFERNAGQSAAFCAGLIGMFAMVWRESMSASGYCAPMK